MLGTARFSNNEIAKAGDFNYIGQKMIENLDTILSGAFGLTDFIFSGFDVAAIAPASMNVSVASGLGLTSQGLVHLQTAISPVPVAAADGSSQRIDTVEIRRVKTSFDGQQRAFKGPLTQKISYQTIDTKTRWEIEVNIVTGTPGSASAPAHTAGWLKIGEITVPAGATTVTNEHIENVGATFSGAAVPGWTNEPTATWSFGSLAAFLVAFRSMHLASGDHKADSIQTRHIDWGTGGAQVSATDIPIGSPITGGVPQNSTVSVHAALESASTRHQKLLARVNRASVPVGTIWMYDGANWRDNVTLPGWYACVPENEDGGTAGLSYGITSLVDRFVMGKAATGAGATAGANSYQLTASQLPAHTHTINHDHAAFPSGGQSVDHTHTITGTATTVGNHNHRVFATIYSGGGADGLVGGNNRNLNNYSGVTTNSGSHTHSVSGGTSSNSVGHTHQISVPSYTGNSGATGAGTEIDNRPAFYSLIFIRKCA